MQKIAITKEELTGMVGASIFMILILVILLFSYFTLATPTEDLEGIPVMFGNIESATGYEEPPMNEIVPPQQELPTPNENIPSEIPLIAQSDEQSIEIEEEKNREKEEEERQKQAMLEEQRRRQEEAERKRREEEKRKEAIKKEMSGLFGENANANRGTSEGGEGTQGVSTGNASQGQTSGQGGIGSYDLGGRSVGRGGLAQPQYTVDDYGEVVVNITVDPNGNVISAEVGKGTTTANSTLRNEALKAARSTKFVAISDNKDQKGTITYKFNLK